MFRIPHHNVYELTHRFVGWGGKIFAIAFTVLYAFWDIDRQAWNVDSHRLLIQPELWITFAMVLLIVFAWITTTKVAVVIDAPSDKATIIRVPGGLTAGLHTRISTGGLREWHIFGTVSEGKKADFHYIVAAVLGDFTQMINVKRPQKLYTKQWKPCSLPYLARNFARGLAICTGSGIGAVASACIQFDNWFLIWIATDFEKTYGKDFMQFMHEKIPPSRRLFWDTRGPLGRPDVISLLHDSHHSWKAEVSVFVGNPTLTCQILRGCRALNIPAFGPIWDA